MGSNSVTYRGYGNQKSAGGRLIVVDIDGDLSPLPHQSKHSPTGMSWGYSGSGAADLARSLLIHALGDRACCPTCAGTGEVVYDTATRSDIPISTRSPEADPGRYSEVMGCNECEDGLCRPPSLLPAVQTRRRCWPARGRMDAHAGADPAVGRRTSKKLRKRNA